LANDILDRVIEQVREDEMRVHIREEITARNRDLAGEGKRAGCKGWEYAELHNAGYRGLYNGLDEGGIHRLKGLIKNQKILDHMIAAEGAANLFRITQAQVAMQAQNPKTPQQAFNIAHSAGTETREAMKRIGGVMPEKMPVADNINEAKKRLKANRPLLEKD
jgi:DNA-damage-inducible protein D